MKTVSDTSSDVKVLDTAPRTIAEMREAAALRVASFHGDPMHPLVDVIRALPGPRCSVEHYNEPAEERGMCPGCAGESPEPTPKEMALRLWPDGSAEPGDLLDWRNVAREAIRADRDHRLCKRDGRG